MATPSVLIGAAITESAQNITTEHLLFTHTAVGEELVEIQISFSSLNAAAALIRVRLEHTLGNDTVVAYNRDCCTVSKWAAANTAAGMRLLGPVLLLDGEKLNVYGYSDNASDTSVTYLAKVLNANFATSANLTHIKDTALPAESVAGRDAAALGKLLDVATPVLTCACVNQTGDSYTKTSGLTAQETRDALKLAPTAGTPDAGSIDADLDLLVAVKPASVPQTKTEADAAAALLATKSQQTTDAANLVKVKAAVYDTATNSGTVITLSNGVTQTISDSGRVTT